MKKESKTTSKTNIHAEFMEGLGVPNATEVTAATKIPVLDQDLKLNSWIKPENLPQGKLNELIESIDKLTRSIEEFDITIGGLKAEGIPLIKK